MMKKFIYRNRFVFIPFGVVAFISLVGFIVMQLWNHLVPGIFGITTINFWQALGLFILCKILFGFGSGGKMGPPGRMRARMAERLKHMDPEEREKFRSVMKDRMCGWESKSPESM